MVPSPNSVSLSRYTQILSLSRYSVSPSLSLSRYSVSPSRFILLRSPPCLPPSAVHLARERVPRESAASQAATCPADRGHLLGGTLPVGHVGSRETTLPEPMGAPRPAHSCLVCVPRPSPRYYVDADDDTLAASRGAPIQSSAGSEWLKPKKKQPELNRAPSPVADVRALDGSGVFCGVLVPPRARARFSGCPFGFSFRHG